MTTPLSVAPGPPFMPLLLFLTMHPFLVATPLRTPLLFLTTQIPMTSLHFRMTLRAISPLLVFLATTPVLLLTTPLLSSTPIMMTSLQFVTTPLLISPLLFLMVPTILLLTTKRPRTPNILLLSTPVISWLLSINNRNGKIWCRCGLQCCNSPWNGAGFFSNYQ